MLDHSAVFSLRAEKNDLRIRGWRNLRLFSAAGNSFKRDYHVETHEGFQRPMLTVFHPTDSGQDPRHAGTLEPLWNIFDLTPEGRPSDWNEQLDYDCCHGGTPRPPT